MDNFSEAFDVWIADCQKIVNKHYDDNFPSQIDSGKLTWKSGKKYIKVFSGNGVWAFVNTTNGDILKAASWKAPAKHARGNLFDSQKGLGWITPYGPAYLR